MGKGTDGVSLILGILGIVISVTPLPLTTEQRLAVIAAGLTIFISVVLSNVNRRLDEYEQKQEKLEEKLKIHEQLIEIRASLQELQKRVFKK